MKTLEMAKATAPLAEYARDVNKEPVIVTVRGKPIAALVSVENADLETITLSVLTHNSCENSSHNFCENHHR